MYKGWLLNSVLLSFQKQIQTLNKLCSSLLEKLNNPRDDRDSETSGRLTVDLSLYLLTCHVCKVIDVKLMLLFSFETKQAILQSCRHERSGGSGGVRKGPVEMQTTRICPLWSPWTADDVHRSHTTAGHNRWNHGPSGRHGRTGHPTAAWTTWYHIYNTLI